MRLVARARGDTALAKALPGAPGRADYWALKHREGAWLLHSRQAAARVGWIAPYLVGIAQIGAGQLDAGFTTLDAEVRNGSRMPYTLPCSQEIDEVRDSPRYITLLKAAGRLDSN